MDAPMHREWSAAQPIGNGRESGTGDRTVAHDIDRPIAPQIP
ncbi:MAG: hypothetical protein ACAF42_05070 [Limnothrix sp. BL-A-16]